MLEPWIFLYLSALATYNSNVYASLIHVPLSWIADVWGWCDDRALWPPRLAAATSWANTGVVNINNTQHPSIYTGSDESCSTSSGKLSVTWLGKNEVYTCRDYQQRHSAPCTGRNLLIFQSSVSSNPPCITFIISRPTGPIDIDMTSLPSTTEV